VTCGNAGCGPSCVQQPAADVTRDATSDAARDPSDVCRIELHGVQATRYAAHLRGMTSEPSHPADGQILGWHDLRASDRVALTPTEVARLLGVDRRTISRAIEDGDLPGVRIGRKIFISREALVRKFEAAA